MKVSELWLREWVNPALTGQQLAAQLTMAGLEVDAISPVAGIFNKVIVAEVLHTKIHPQADRLTLCEINTGSGEHFQVVCGASNVRSGLKVALATIGAHLPGDFIIKETKLRGEISQGMLCSLAELGMAENSEGIMELEENATIGMDLREYLLLNDNIIDIDLTPNRPDCFSVLGVAREIATLNDLPLYFPEILPVEPKIDDLLTIEVKNPEACPRYCGRIIRGINSHAITPLWMAERLRRSGIRLIHPVVDVSNYVMLELGQPMHAFDLNAVDGGIVVRFARESERLTLLDGQEVILQDEVLVIADHNKPLAMAGIMGGEFSAVQDTSTDIFLESAFFNPLTIAGVARSYGLASDASQRFERGVDPFLADRALERATALLLTIVGGKVAPIKEVTESKYIPFQPSILFETSKVQQLTGVSMSLERMRNILQGLGMQVVQESATVLQVEVPTYRFDIHEAVDLVEEIIRIYGYDNLKAQPARSLIEAGSVAVNESLMHQLTHWFSTRGYNETISYSFVDPELQQILYPNCVTMKLLNPISSELSEMRVGMWPGLIASMMHNLHRQQNRIRIFEAGVIFEVSDGNLSEIPSVAGLITGEQGGLNWSEPTRFFDFYDVKGDLEALFTAFKCRDIQFIADTHSALHPGQSARIMVDNQEAGWVGVLHPHIADFLDVPHDVILFELSLAVFTPDNVVRNKSISKYPQIRRDLSFLVKTDVSVKEIELVVRQTVKEDWLRAFDVFDVYTGKGVPEGQKSLAIAITLQDSGRTLVDAEINLIISAIIKELEHKFTITLRD